MFLFIQTLQSILISILLVSQAYLEQFPSPLSNLPILIRQRAEQNFKKQKKQKPQLNKKPKTKQKTTNNQNIPLLNKY